MSSQRISVLHAVTDSMSTVSLLAESRLRQDGYFNFAPIQKIWREHLSGKTNWEYHLWDVLTFQAWLDESRRKSDHSSSHAEGIANLAMGSA